jgi:hypothetical protein
MSSSEGDVALDRLAGKLERLPAQRRALRRGMRQFGDDFDARSWARAFDSSEPDDINRVLVVTGGYLALVNNTIEAIKVGAGLVGLRPTPRMRGAAGLIDAIHRDGGLSRQQADTFIELHRTRNAIQHASPDVQADEVHRQVRLLLLLRHLPRFVGSYVAWLALRGVELDGGP